MKTRCALLVLLLATGAALAADPAKADPPKAGSPKTGPAKTAKPPAAAAAPAPKEPAPAAPKDAPAPKDAAEPKDTTAPKDAAASNQGVASKKDAPDLGMSILGNQEAPKALVIVPWKSSEVGDSMGISTVLDDARLPIDKEVFMRALSYFDLKLETTRHDGAMPASAAQGGKR